MVKIKRQLHRTDIDPLLHKIDNLEYNLKQLREHLKTRNPNKREVDQINFGLMHGVHDLIDRTNKAISSIGKEME